MKTDHASPRITEPMDTPERKAKTALALISSIKANIDYAKATEVETATDAFETEAKNLVDANADVTATSLAASKAVGRQLVALRRFEARKRGLLTAVDLRCDGSKDAVTAYGFGVVERHETPIAVVPEGLHRMKSKLAGVAGAAWDPQSGAQGFMVQYATDVNDPATYSTPKANSKASFKLTGLAPGATVYFRVYAVDARLPTGQTDFTPWLKVMATT